MSEEDDEDGRTESIGVERPALDPMEGQAMKGRIATRLFGDGSGPVLIGRFELLESIGAGGMGLVHRARDPTLGREVALKVLHPGIVGGERDRARLLREAQALARLSHPNVVQLYEVGEHAEGLFLAMEYVPGVSLAHWQEAEDHDAFELLEVYAQAGRGLAAAHAAGLVHRDVKPSNVLVGDDGRVRIADFGLARGPGLGLDSETSERPTTATTGDQEPLTRTGAVMGTPAYMSPEQRRGETIDVRSDQYSFCVALWEAVLGGRPRADATWDDLGPDAVTDGPASILPRPAVRRLVDILSGGLRRSPDERWPTMDALLDELSLVRTRSRWRGLATLAILGAVGAFGWAVVDSGPHPACERLERAAPHWTTAHGQTLREAASMLSIEGRERLATSVDQRMREQMDQWDDVAGRVCEDADADSEVEPRTACLQALARRFDLEARVLLEEPDALLGAHGSLAQLLGPRLCETRPAVVLGDIDGELDEETRVELTRGRVLTESGRYDDALAIYDALAGHGDEEPSLRAARAEMGRAEVSRQRGLLDRARRQQRRVVEQALALSNPGLGALAWARLARVEAEREDYEAARWSARQCQAAAHGVSSPLVRSECWHALARAYPGPAAAFISLPLSLLALETRREVYGPGHPSESTLRQHIAHTYADVGEHIGDPELTWRARAIYTEERERARQRYGSQHPTVLVLDFDLALLDVTEGRLEPARDALMRVVEGLEAAYGRTSKFGGPLITLAQVEAMLGDLDASWNHVERAIAVHDELPREHSECGAALSFAAQLAEATGDFERALTLYERLAERWGEQGTGVRNLVWHNVAYYRCVVRGCEGAADAAGRVDPGAVATNGAAARLNVDVVYGMIALADGDPEGARLHAQRVLRGLDGVEVERPEAFEAEARWTLARAARAMGEEQEARRQSVLAVGVLGDEDALGYQLLRRIDAAPLAWTSGADPTNFDGTDFGVGVTNVVEAR